MAKFVEAPKTAESLYEWMRRVSYRVANKHLYFSETSVGNSAGALTDLHSTTLPTIQSGYFWRGAGQLVRVTASGTFAANANTKNINFLLNLASCPFSGTWNGGKWWAQCEFWMSDVSTLKANGILWTTVTPAISIGGLGYAAAGVRVGEAATVKSQGGTTGANDVIETMFRVEWLPSPDSY